MEFKIDRDRLSLLTDKELIDESNFLVKLSESGCKISVQSDSEDLPFDKEYFIQGHIILELFNFSHYRDELYVRQMVNSRLMDIIKNGKI